MFKCKNRLTMRTAMLTVVVAMTLILNASAMLNDYLLFKQVKTSTSSGSSLAERYLLLGDWPASHHHDFTSSNTHYPINIKRKAVTKRERDD